jgi:nucleotide-binding universal stress UspA family protein
MLNRIIVPLDGSKMAEAVLPFVEEIMSGLKRGIKGEVVLFHVLSPTYYVVAGEAGAPVPYTEAELEQIKQKTMEYLDKAGEDLRNKGIRVECRVGVGRAAEEIIKVADEIDASLVAMSTHGRSGLSRWAFGSVTDKVLRGGNRPVLMVRAPQDTEKT